MVRYTGDFAGLLCSFRSMEVVYPVGMKIFFPGFVQARDGRNSEWIGYPKGVNLMVQLNLKKDLVVAKFCSLDNVYYVDCYSCQLKLMS